VLVLARKKDDRIIITVGEVTITIVVVETGSDRVRLGIDAPRDVLINRGEIQKSIDSEGAE